MLSTWDMTTWRAADLALQSSTIPSCSLSAEPVVLDPALSISARARSKLSLIKH